MSFEITQLFFTGIGYLGLLFFIAFATVRGWIPDSITRHPIIYVLSLGVFSSVWSVYGVVGLAYDYGYGVLAYYLGTAAIFLFSPIILVPLARICRLYQLSSLPDLLAFRFRSQWVGAIATSVMFFGVLPLMVLQIQAVADTIHILSESTVYFLSDEGASRNQAAEIVQDNMALMFVGALILFTILFGSTREQFKGLVAAMAFETFFKVIVLLTIGFFAVYQVFGGLDQLDQWLLDHPRNLALLHAPAQEVSPRTLVLVFVASIVAMPHMFQFGLSETANPQTLRFASWAMPLLLLILSLPIFPILWAGFELNSPLSPEYFTIAVGMEGGSATLTLLTFIGGLSAASGSLIVVTLAQSTMFLNHFILHIYQPGKNRDIYRWIMWIRRLLISMILIAGYLAYTLLEDQHTLSTLAIVGFIGTLQFLPGLLAVLYWPQANGKGFIAGIIAGTIVWAETLLIPLFTQAGSMVIPIVQMRVPVGIDVWDWAAMSTLAANVFAFILVSLLTRTSPAEAAAGRACAIDNLSRPVRQELDVHNPAQFIDQLAKSLGRKTAEKEVQKALADLALSDDETRPYALRRLRDRIEANLSGLMGPAVANEIVEVRLPYQHSEQATAQEDIHFIENRLNDYRNNLTGLAAELDELRRYHRQTLEALPLGICSLGQDGEIVMWNQAMAELTDIDSDQVVGSTLTGLAEPWCEVMAAVAHSEASHTHKQRLEQKGKPRWLSLHKALLDSQVEGRYNGQVILVEDTTETQMLEDELIHSERLASIGRLAAGVAHEIGNPITGIACLCQNLQYETDNEYILETGEQILSQTERVSRIVQSLMSFAHSGQQAHAETFGPVDIQFCVQEAINLISLNKEKHHVEFINQIDDEMFVSGDSQRLLQVFVNLLDNARDASPDDGHIFIDSEADQGSITLYITDEGHGIPDDVLDQIFEPFFTTKDPGKGTGLGLPLVYSIIEDHYGHIEFESPADPEEDCGTRVTITLPRSQESEDNDSLSDCQDDNEIGLGTA